MAEVSLDFIQSQFQSIQTQLREIKQPPIWIAATRARCMTISQPKWRAEWANSVRE